MVILPGLRCLRRPLGLGCRQSLMLQEAGVGVADEVYAAVGLGDATRLPATGLVPPPM